MTDRAELTRLIVSLRGRIQTRRDAIDRKHWEIRDLRNQLDIAIAERKATK